MDDDDARRAGHARARGSSASPRPRRSAAATSCACRSPTRCTTSDYAERVATIRRGSTRSSGFVAGRPQRPAPLQQLRPLDAVGDARGGQPPRTAPTTTSGRSTSSRSTTRSRPTPTPSSRTRTPRPRRPCASRSPRGRLAAAEAPPRPALARAPGRRARGDRADRRASRRASRGPPAGSSIGRRQTNVAPGRASSVERAAQALGQLAADRQAEAEAALAAGARCRAGSARRSSSRSAGGTPGPRSATSSVALRRRGRRPSTRIASPGGREAQRVVDAGCATIARDRARVAARPSTGRAAGTTSSVDAALARPQLELGGDRARQLAELDRLAAQLDAGVQRG